MKKDTYIKTLLLISIAGLFAGCSTTTRLGQVLIPAHPNSSVSKGEEVRFVVEHGSTVKATKGFTAAPVAAWLADQAVGLVAEEMRNEAKSYSKQYSGKIRDTFGFGIHTITLYRLVDNVSGAEPVLGDRFKVDQTIIDGFKTDKKKVASAYRFELTISEFTAEQSYGSLDLKEVYFSDSKAKVVGLNAKPWQFLGALLLKTGDAVNVEVNVALRGIGKNGPVTIIDSKFPENGFNFELGKPDYKENKQLGEWVLMGFGKDGTPVTLEVRITESDPSNIQKMLESGAKKIDDSRKSP